MEEKNFGVKEKQQKEKLTLWTWVKRERITDTISVSCVKWTNPVMPFNCWRQTTVAAPPMNPTIVACDKKSTISPNLHFQSHWRLWIYISTYVIVVIWYMSELVVHLRNPREAWKTPAKKVAVKTNWTYSFGCSTGLTSFPNMADISNDATATVPTAISFELPSMAYINGGTKLESTLEKKNH